MTVELREFLEARLTDDEAVARSALSSRPWWPGDERIEPTEVWVSDYHEVRRRKVDRSWYSGPFMSKPLPYIVVADCSPGGFSDARHIARHDPGRAIREVEAKRALLARHAREERWAGSEGMPSGRFLLSVSCSTCRDGSCDDDYDATCAYSDEPCIEVRLLGAVYRDHPDYDPSWSPS